MRSASVILAALAVACVQGVLAQPGASSPAVQPLTAPAAAAVLPSPKPSESMTGSVTTVGELLKVENQLALKAAQKAKQDAGLGAAPVAVEPGKLSKPLPPPPVLVQVDSILGTGSALRANLMVGSESFENVRPGSRIATCEIVRIENRCVVLRPVELPGKAKGPACPTACWTGVKPVAPVMSAGAPGMPGAPLPAGTPGMPLPAPMPMAQPQGIASPATGAFGAPSAPVASRN
ncbi:hypothetical protein [Ramlibacter sp. AN1133]|uniref:hypothetical protein n=1 Tax=Ramlibacter sp. AN1133 TaxID=3133429 RepID=UPI0030C53CBB